MQIRLNYSPSRLEDESSANKIEVSHKRQKSYPHFSIQKQRYQLTKEEEQEIQENKSPFKKIKPSPYLFRYRQTTKDPQISKVQESLKLLDMKEEDLPPQFQEMLIHASKLSSTIYAGNIKPQEKSLYFSLLALTLLEEEGIVVVVTPHHSYLKEKFRRINNIVNWAAINSQVDSTQRECVISHIDSGNVKLFLVHPEYLSSVQAHQVSVLVLDEAQSYIPELGFPNGLWQPNLKKFIEDVNPKAVQIFMPRVSCNSMTQLVSDPPLPYQFFGFHQTSILSNPLTSTRDDDPLKSLTQLFRSPRLFRKSGILVYCSSKVEVEETSTFLTSNGFKCGSLLAFTCETKRQAILYDFAKNSIDILILPSGLLLPEGFKNYAYLSVHVNIPLSVDVLINDISELNCQANSHVFLAPSDFTQQRNTISSSFLNIRTIDKFISSVFNDQQDTGDSKQTKVKSLKVSFTKQYKQINETLSLYDFTRESLFSIISELVKCEWMKLEMSVPSEVLVKIPKKECNSDPFISFLIRNGKRCISSRQMSQDVNVRCQVDMITLDSGLSVKEVIQNLKRLSLKKILSFQIMEEILYFEIHQNVDRSLFEAKIIEVYTQLQRQIHLELLKFDQVSSLLKHTSFKTLEHMWRQVKLKGNVLQVNIETYLLENTHPTVELPFINLQTQREKSNVMVDVQVILEEMCPNVVLDRWIEKESFASDALVILQGLSRNSWSTQWKSSSIWKKYEKYKYECLHQAILDWLVSHQFKKIKIQ